MSLKGCNTEHSKNVRRKARQRYNKRYYSQTSNLYEKKRWSPDEDDMVLKRVLSDVNLSILLQRSVGAIQHRRHNLKKKENENG